MPTKTVLTLFGSTVTVLAIAVASSSLPAAQAQAPAALSGIVSSPDEGNMEGVLVSAKREGSIVTVTVVSDAQGRYSFPRGRMEPGRYTLRTRAVGYDLSGPGAVEITAAKPAQVDLTLGKTKDLAAQLSNAEWLDSWPGTNRQKLAFSECITCHTLEPIVRSKYTAEQWQKVIPRMRTWRSGSTRRNPIKRLHIRPGGGHVPEEQAEYLASINLSKAPTWSYSLKTFPRPKGKATRVIITEWDLPRRVAAPHDVVVDSQGLVWYGDFAYNTIGVLDPKTGKIEEYSVPEVKPGYDPGFNNIEIDREGNLWLALFNQPGLAFFDRKTKAFKTWALPPELYKDGTRTVFTAAIDNRVDGKVWLGGGMETTLLRVDLKSNQWESINLQKDLGEDSPLASRPHGIYDIVSDSKNNVYNLDMRSEYIVKVDAKTLKVTYYQTPTLNSGPRRGHMDDKDRLWFAEHHSSNKMGMFDTNTGQFKEWTSPTPHTNPYDAIADKNEDLWMGGMASDRITRVNTHTNEIIEYLLPRTTNVRRVYVDNGPAKPAFWVGNNDEAMIIRLEPLE